MFNNQPNDPPFAGTHPSFEDDLQQLAMLMKAKDAMIVNRSLPGGYDGESTSIGEAIIAISRLIKVKAEWQAANIPPKATPL